MTLEGSVAEYLSYMKIKTETCRIPHINYG